MLQKFLEGLQNDMKEIETQPPDAKAMRRTFTLERILSGAEGDLQALAKEVQEGDASAERAADFANGGEAGPSGQAQNVLMALEAKRTGSPMLQQGPPLQLVRTPDTLV